MEKIKSQKIALYGFFTAVALLFGYVEYLVPLNFIAPGVKLGFPNGVFLLLLFGKKFKAAFIVNLVRILLSGLLFSTPFSLLFSLTAGTISMLVMQMVFHCKKTGFIGVSVTGAVSHNFTQLCVASLTVGQGVWYYLPLLLLSGIATGVIIGFLTYVIFKRVYKTNFFRF